MGAEPALPLLASRLRLPGFLLLQAPLPRGLGPSLDALLLRLAGAVRFQRQPPGLLAHLVADCLVLLERLHPRVSSGGPRLPRAGPDGLGLALQAPGHVEELRLLVEPPPLAVRSLRHQLRRRLLLPAREPLPGEQVGHPSLEPLQELLLRLLHPLQLLHVR